MDSFARLPFFSLLQVSGVEAGDFLQRQFINDLGTLETQRFQHNAWCNRQGQVIVNFFIAKTDQGWWILLPAELAPSFLEGLQRFVLRSKLILHPIDPTLAVIGLCGAGISAQLASLFGTNAATQGQVVQRDGVILWCLFGGADRYLLTGASATLRPIQKAATANCPEHDAISWSTQDISAGMPWITAATSALFLPQYLSLDLQQAMSLEKGCYPGQEVIARLHYRGKVKYRLKALYSKQPCALSAGHRIIARAQHVGTVVNAATEKARTIMLAVCPVSDAGTLLLEDLNLPLYALPGGR